MSLDKNQKSPTGILLIDKPAGITSFDVVRRIKRVFGKIKIGHTGTLDPNATGLLVLCLNQATKLVPFLQAGEKEYSGSMILGLVTDTEDITGRVVAKKTNLNLTDQEIISTAEEFVGEIDQVPPEYAALKFNGRPGYELARRGEKVPRRVRKVHIHRLEVTGIELPRVFFEVKVSKGTYVRSLVSDWGRRLGSGACLEELRRVSNALYTLDDALTLAEAEELGKKGELAARVIPLNRALPFIPEVSVPEICMDLVRNGQPLPVTGLDAYNPHPGLVRLISPDKDLMAIYEFHPNSIPRAEGVCLQPVRILRTA